MLRVKVIGLVPFRGRAVRVLLSFNAEDVALAEAFRATLFILAPDLEVFFSPILYEGYRAIKFHEADALIFFVARHGLSDLQRQELHRAFKRAKTDSEFTIVPVLAGSANPPELSTSLDWIDVPVVTDQNTLTEIIAVLESCSARTERTRERRSHGFGSVLLERLSAQRTGR